ncbi:MAG TPA: ribonuclease R [Candidatus Paceibacterota bacterium]
MRNKQFKNNTKSPGKQTHIKLEGQIRVTGRGSGFFEIEGVTKGKDVLEIETKSLKTALNNDTVEVIRLPRTGKVVTGEVTKIIKRAKTRFVGTVDCDESGKCFLIPDDRRVYVDFTLPSLDKLEAKPGEKILIEMVAWSDPKGNPEGKLLKVLGKKGEHETEIAAILYDSGFAYDFPEDVEREANGASSNFKNSLANESKNRRDLRATPTFTIDPVDAKDFDDAISVVEVGDGKLEVGVHIADVSFYVRPGTALDREAQERATSVYLVDRTIPMLPEALSNEICSLKPDEDRLAYSAIFTLDKDGKLVKEWFGRTIIRSQKRFTYEEAQGVLDAGNGPMVKELVLVRDLAKIFRKKRMEAGSILFDKEEVRVVLGEDKKVIEIFVKPRYETQWLIEEWMLMANRKVAEFMSKAIGAKKIPGFIYRIHDRPDREKIESLAIFLKGIGVNLNQQKGTIQGSALNKMFREIEGLDTEELIKQAALRSMSKAIYTTKNVGHYGLAFDDYTHFTSPIRRYPDIMVHRLLELYLSSKNISADTIHYYNKLAAHSSQKEVEAERAERDSVKMKQVEFMSGHIGEEVEGIITGVTDWGIYVEELKTKTTGLVRIAEIGDDYYELDEKNYQLIGTKTKRKFRLGDKLKVKVAKVDIESKSLDFTLVR